MSWGSPLFLTEVTPPHSLCRCYAEAAVKKDAFRVCISALVAKDPPLEFWTPLGLDSTVGCVRAGAAATAAPGPSASTPSPSPAPIASSAPHPDCLQRLGRGRRGGGEPGGAGRDVPVASPQPRRMNGSGRAGGAQGLGRGLRGALSHLQSPGRPSWAPSLGCGPLLPPGGRGAGVSWEGRSRGRVGLGAGRRRLGGGEGGSGRPAAGRGPAGWPRAWPDRATSTAPPGAVLGGRVRPGPRGGPFPREALGSR